MAGLGQSGAYTLDREMRAEAAARSSRRACCERGGDGKHHRAAHAKAHRHRHRSAHRGRHRRGRAASRRDPDGDAGDRASGEVPRCGRGAPAACARSCRTGRGRSCRAKEDYRSLPAELGTVEQAIEARLRAARGGRLTGRRGHPARRTASPSPRTICRISKASRSGSGSAPARARKRERARHLASPRAHGLQGHRAGAAPATSPRRSRRSAAR